MADEMCLSLFLLLCLPHLTFQCQEKIAHKIRFSGTIFKTMKKSRLFSCAADCVAYSLCKSLSFDRKEMTCFLHLEDGYGQPANLLNDDWFTYSSIKNWDNVVLGPCQTFTCEPYEKCVVYRRFRRCVDVRRLLSSGKETKASSSYRNTPTAFAVDGNLGSIWTVSTCFHVRETGGWWQVDLGSEAVITDVLIVNRGDSCCYKRFRNFDLETFTEDPSVDPTAEAHLCYRHPDEPLAAGAAVTFSCTTPLVGRYFRVSIHNPLDDENFVQLCEVEVNGWPIE